MPSPPREETTGSLSSLENEGNGNEHMTLAPSGFSLFEQDAYILCFSRKESSTLGDEYKENRKGRSLKDLICRFKQG